MKTAAVAGIIGGLFVGALVVEVLAKRRSGIVAEIRDGTHRALDSIATGFKEGYRDTAGPPRAE